MIVSAASDAVVAPMSIGKCGVGMASMPPVIAGLLRCAQIERYSQAAATCAAYLLKKTRGKVARNAGLRRRGE